MLNIIIPLAGSSELFNNVGYYYPKPLIEIKGKIMIEHAILQASELNDLHRFIFIIKEEDAIKFHLDNTLKLLAEGCIIIKLNNQTKGALCSTLMSIDLMDSNDEILVLNGDQIIDFDFNEFAQKWRNENVDAGLVTFNSIHPRWSYALLENDNVVKTAEKNPISKNAIAGYYYFRNARDFFINSFAAIKNEEQVNGNYYLSSVINYYVLNNKSVKIFPISNSKYHSFYSPQMVNEFERK